MARHRTALLSIYGHLYKLYEPYGRYSCAYCGEAASDLDHCPPLAVVYQRGSDFFRQKSIEFLLVPSCRECNAVMGALPIFHVNHRRRFIRDKYLKRYAKILDAAFWSSDERQELGHNLRLIVDAVDGQRLRLKRRLHFLS